VAREVPCPRCGTRREWSGNPDRPFCSERCKLIDLGSWLTEKHSIPDDAAEFPEAETPKH
jgi:uncharacterized protein